MSLSYYRRISFALFASACAPGPAISTTGDASTSAADATSSASTGSSSEATPTSEGSTSTPVACPNGVLEDGEACDDGNAIDGDGCNADCTTSGALLAEYRSGEAGSDFPRDVAVDDQGMIIVGGYRGGRLWVSRFSADLSMDWTKQFGAGPFDIVTGVAVNDDAVYAVGAIGESEMHDSWVGRLDAQGTLLWESTQGGPGEDYASEVALSPDGSVYLTGMTLFEEVLSMTLTNLSPDGDLIWETTIPTGNDFNIFPLGPGLAVSADAAIIVFGRRTMDASAEMVASYPLSGGAPNWMVDLPATQGILLGAASNSDASLVVTGSHLSEHLIVRHLTASGALSWSSDKCTGDTGRDLAVDGQGDIVVIGDGPGAAFRNIRLCKFSAEGELRWAKDIDGFGGEDNGYAVAIGPDNRIVAAGAMFNEESDSDTWLAIFSP